MLDLGLNMLPRMCAIEWENVARQVADSPMCTGQKCSASSHYLCSGNFELEQERT